MTFREIGDQSELHVPAFCLASRMRSDLGWYVLSIRTNCTSAMAEETRAKFGSTATPCLNKSMAPRAAGNGSLGLQMPASHIEIQGFGAVRPSLKVRPLKAQGVSGLQRKRTPHAFFLRQPDNNLGFECLKNVPLGDFELQL